MYQNLIYVYFMAFTNNRPSDIQISFTVITVKSSYFTCPLYILEHKILKYKNTEQISKNLIVNKYNDSFVKLKGLHV
jgi:MFS-type transporter involved in bile tolerance (Atg22 family)